MREKMSSDIITDEEAEQFICELKKNIPKINKGDINEKIYTDLTRHRFFQNVMNLWLLTIKHSDFTALIFSQEFGKTRAWALNFLELMCNYGILNRKIGYTNKYYPIKNDKGETIIQSVFKYGMRYHAKCCLKEKMKEFKTRENFNKKLGEFVVKEEG
jgi:hypothetical protein